MREIDCRSFACKLLRGLVAKVSGGWAPQNRRIDLC